MNQEDNFSYIIREVTNNPSLLASKYQLDTIIDEEKELLLSDYLETLTETQRKAILSSVIEINAADDEGNSGIVLNAAVLVNAVAYVNVAVVTNVVAQVIAYVQAGVEVSVQGASGGNNYDHSSVTFNPAFVETTLHEKLSELRLSLARQKALIKHAVKSTNTLVESGSQTIEYAYKGKNMQINLLKNGDTIEVVNGSIH